MKTLSKLMVGSCLLLSCGDPTADLQEGLSAEDAQAPDTAVADFPAVTAPEEELERVWGDLETTPEAILVRTLTPGWEQRLGPRVVYPVLVAEERVSIALSDDPALVLARMMISEEGWSSPAGWDAMWDVVNNVRLRHCDTTMRRLGRRGQRITQCLVSGETVSVTRGQTLDGEETHLSAMRRLSWFVSGMIPPLHSRQRWTSTLQPSDDPPLNWRECDDTDASCDGRWDHYVERWADAREHASRNVERGRTTRACPRPVLAWGGLMDRPIMEARNASRTSAGLRPLVRVDCGETLNEFYAVEAADGNARERHSSDSTTEVDWSDDWDPPRERRSGESGEGSSDVDSMHSPVGDSRVPS